MATEQLSREPKFKEANPPIEHALDATIITPSHNVELANQLLNRHKFSTHHPKSGLNPLVDASAYLFSIIGKLKKIKSYRHLNKLNKELITEINAFQEVAKAHNYSSEYILVSRYALCATLDDVISNTAWGTHGQWDSFSLLKAFNQESGQPDRFFIILERIIKNPELYIDLMEFMYLCLSLGFKGNYRLTEFNNNQFELICNALYKRIRAFHGDFNKTLSPFPLKPAVTNQPSVTTKKFSIFFIMISTASIILALFIGLGYLLDTVSNQAYQELMHIGKSILYETHDT